MKLNVKAFALACAIIFGLALLAFTWVIILKGGYQVGARTIIGQILVGYRITPVGSVVGLIWAFFGGLIGGSIFALVYNIIDGFSSYKKEG